MQSVIGESEWRGGFIQRVLKAIADGAVTEVGRKQKELARPLLKIRCMSIGLGASAG